MWHWPALTCLALALLPGGASATPDGADTARGKAALRAMDCARCHGRDYRGWSAPSLIAAVRYGTRERFDHYVLEGDITRGMPGYRGQPLVVAELNAIHAYLCEQAAASTGATTNDGYAPRTAIK